MDVRNKVFEASNNSLQKMKSDEDRFVMGVYVPGIEGAEQAVVKLKAVDDSGTMFDVLKGAELFGNDQVSISEIVDLNYPTNGGPKLDLYGISEMTKALSHVRDIAIQYPEVPYDVAMSVSMDNPGELMNIKELLDEAMNVPSNENDLEPEPLHQRRKI